MHRHMIAHGEHVTRAIEDGAGIVAALLDIRRESGSAQHAAHFLRDGMEQVFEDFQAHGIEFHRPRSISRLPYASTRTFQPGSTTVVALYSATIAGPRKRFPARNLALS